ncbi:MAG: hypothetical protein IJ886_02480 [Prevotella sp.]|nr:hypothetical protein [Prevotella sp.]
MDNKIFSTTYVPLRPPFQIIKYSDDIAMQIGTLIVTIQKEGNVNDLGYAIETHSHPVVAYDNKFKTEPNHQLTAYHFLEGAVWNNVEVKDVTTICLTNSQLSWQDFRDFLWHEVCLRPQVRLVHPTIGAYWTLEKLCGGVKLPAPGHYIIALNHYHYEGRGQADITPAIRSRWHDNLLILHAEDINEDKTLEILARQLSDYSLILSRGQYSAEEFSITFKAGDKFLYKLVENLNRYKVLTSPIEPLSYWDMLDVIKGRRDNNK